MLTTVTAPGTFTQDRSRTDGLTHIRLTHTVPATAITPAFSLTMNLRQHGDQYLRLCDTCEGLHVRAEYRRSTSTCLACNGTGLASTTPLTLSEARIRLRHRAEKRLRHLTEGSAQDHADRRRAQSEHPEFAAALAEFEAAARAAAPTPAEFRRSFAHATPHEVSEGCLRAGGRAVSAVCWALREQFRADQGLEPDRMRAFCDAWAQAREEARLRERSRFVGQEGARLALSLRVAFTRWYDNPRSGTGTYRVVAHGTGVDEGVIAAWYSTAAWVREAAPGQEVTVLGVVKDHKEGVLGKVTRLRRVRRIASA